MGHSDGALPGTGFDDDDPVETLSSAPTLARLRAPDGQWLLTPVRPHWADAFDWPDTEIVVAVVDTGICDDHPSIAGRVLEQVDLTGEGSRDEDGHGTAVTAVLLTHSSPATKVVSVKALGRDGRTSIALLSHAMRRAAKLLGDRGVVINVSAGRRTPDCVGDCPLCTTVTQIREESGHRVIAAAGNTPGVTYCPARSAFSISTPEHGAAPGNVVIDLPDWEPVV